MNNDIRPPRPQQRPERLVQNEPVKPLQPTIRPEAVPSFAPIATPENIPFAPAEPSPIPDPPKLSLPDKKKRSGLRKFMIGLIVVVVLAVIAVIGSYVWYNNQLQAVSSDAKSARVRVTIESGASPAMISTQLHDQKLIRSTFAFDIYTRLSGVRDKLKAGTFSLSPHDTTQQIVDHLVAGKTDEFQLTFLPGATITDNKKTLIKAGYAKADVEAAFNKSYVDKYPDLFNGHPASAGLEGYMYGQTYSFFTTATPEDIISRTLDEFNTHVATLKADFQKQGLTLYQGITLASIIQRETSSTTPDSASSDQSQVSQVFYSRLAANMPLGSDVTAYYGADLIGASHAVTVDTPYNTRIHTGLPPGPIATPSLGALIAASHPAAGDYMYFLSGDDNITYFARTNDEHEQNITNHCQVKCSIP
ncbi:MAG: endolytic transglycosylase MltG [Candidatus Saccharimonadales bacterium]